MPGADHAVAAIHGLATLEQALATGLARSLGDGAERVEPALQLYLLLYSGKVQGCSLQGFEDATGLRLTDGDGTLREDLPPITTFLNRLLALTIDLQNTLFEVFEDFLRSKIEGAIASGTYDLGVETVTAESLIVAHLALRQARGQLPTVNGVHVAGQYRNSETCSTGSFPSTTVVGRARVAGDIGSIFFGFIQSGYGASIAPRPSMGEAFRPIWRSLPVLISGGGTP